MSGDFNYFLTICLLSSCFFGATYSQRKVNRNAATGSEGKQVVDFDCPEEFGYYPHPTDCTQYYVCVFGGALLESCTGGLMYSHELQTCDWPRNVGCDAAGTSAVQQSSPDHTPSRQQQSNSGRYAQTQQQTGSLQSRGQTRQQFPTQQQQLPTLRQEEDYQYKKQKQHQQQLYAVAESDLPPVEEIESDRQQRVYRGQPSTVGQVQRDRDALRHTNAIPVQNIRNSKIGVISFGTQQQQSQQQSHIEQPQYRNVTGDNDDDNVTDELDQNFQNETLLTVNNQTLIDLNRLKRQVRYSRIHSLGLGPTKSSRFTWTAGIPKNDYTNRHKGSANNHYARLAPFRPSIPEKPYSSKFNAFDNQFNPQFPIHTILPLIHQQSFDTRPKENTSSVAYYNLNSVQTPSTTLNRPNIEESYTYYNTLSTTSTPPQLSQYYNKVQENTGPQQFEVTEPDVENSKYVHLGRNNYILSSTSENPTKYFYITHKQPISNPSYAVETKYSTTTNRNNQNYRPIKSPAVYDESASSSVEESDTSTENVEEEKESEEEEAFHDDFTPPPYFYNNHNKYEDIENPFANPNFNFDKYLEEISDGGYKKPTEKLRTTTVNIETPRPFKVTTATSTTPSIRKRPTKYDIYDINEYASNIQTNTINRVKTKSNQTKDDLRYSSTPKSSTSSSSTIRSNNIDVNVKHDKNRLNTNESKRVTNNRKQNSRNRQNNQRDKDKKRLLDNHHHRIEPSTLAPEQYAPAPRPVSITTAGNSGNTGRALYNTTSAQNYDQNQYDPYYALYDDDVELYRDVDYGHNYNTAPISESPKQVYRGTPATQPQPVESATVSSRAPAQYIQQDTVPYNVHPQQTLYKQQVSSINDDYSDVSYEVDANQYQSADRNPGRGDRNDLRFPEPTTKKAVKTTTSTTTTTTTSTTTTTRRPATVSSIRLENITENPSPVVTNGTNKHESIFITLTAKPPRYSPTPFQITSSSPPPTNTLLHTSTSTQQNQQDVTIPNRSSTEIDLDNETTKKPSRFISLTAGFTLLDHDKNVRTQLKDPEHSHDSKHNLQFTQYDHMAINDNIEVSTTDDHEPEIHKPIYQITNLPTQKNETITLQLVSALGASTGTTRHTLPTTTHLSVTETPSYKREIATSHHTKNVIESKTSTYIHPTTYSVPKYFLEALFHKTTPQGFKLTPTTTSTTHKPPSTSTTTSRPRIIKEYFNFDYYDDEYVENNTNNTIPLLPYQPQYTSTTLPKKLRTNDVVILPEKVQKNRFTIERKPTSTESNLRTNRIVINRESAAPVPVLPSALMSDDNLTTNDNNDVITDDDEVTPTTSRTFTDLPNHLPNLPIPTSTTPITIVQSTQTSTTTNLPPVPSTTISTSTSYLTSLPGRVSRINPAIKSITTFGGARGSSKCNGNSTISHIKCNEIQQRTNVRGRGSAHYTSAGEDVPINRGTPPTRSRPTLKPSTSIVSKASEFIDIYKYPPTRPSPVYPTPQVDKSAAKCRKDVCLLPDCYCGGKDIPGDLPVESVPQIVLLTFDDSVNDLNKGLYSDLFEKGRVNPNGCPISATFYVSHEWTDYSQVQNLYATGHEIASHTVSHSFGEQFSQKKWNREVAGQREILAAYGGVHLEDVRGMRAPFLSVGGNKMFKMLYDSNFTYDSSMPVYENRPPSWPYTLDYKLFHDCMIPPCPTRSYPGVWEVPMVMWQDLNGGRCSMGDACSNPPAADGVFKMLMKNFDRHYSTNRAPFGLFYHAAWFTQPHHKEGFIQFLDTINAMKDVYLVTNWQAIQWVRDPTPLNRIANFQPFQCNYANRPKKCNNPKVCNLWHKSGVRYMRTCQPCPDIYPWTGKTGIKSSRIDNDIED